MNIARMHVHSKIFNVIDKQFNQEGTSPIYKNTTTNNNDEIELYRGLITDIVVCGHSAGGGLGTLFYYIYNNDISIDKKIPIKNTISFGAHSPWWQDLRGQANSHLWVKHDPSWQTFGGTYAGHCKHAIVNLAVFL